MQYDRIRQQGLLAKNNIELVLVSIGKPEAGQKLRRHLNIANGDEWIFVDPENALYDALQLNSGIETTFFSIETPFAFRDRFFGTNGREDGVKDLIDILSKWKDAVHVPPKQSQAFQQGGVFVFQGKDTVFAHYDAAAGTHLEVQLALDRAVDAASKLK